jgi:hypothetical protein
MSGALAVTCHVGRGRYRYASRRFSLHPFERKIFVHALGYMSREVLDGPIDEGQDRSLECFDILTLLVLQEPHANERVDFRYV